MGSAERARAGATPGPGGSWSAVGAACRALGLAALVIGAARPAAAADTYDLRKADVWQVGDIVTTTIHERDVQELRILGDDGKPVAKPPSDVLVEATLTERCMAVDAAGGRLRTAVYVVSFTAQDGPTKDTSLAGAVLDVAGVGKDRVARVSSSTHDLSKAASAWLSRRYGGGRPDQAAARGYWLPRTPVAVGDTWSADLSTFLDGTAAATRLDRSKTTSSCTLTSVEKSVALVTCTGGLTLTSFPSAESGKPIPWKSGGAQVVQGTITIGLEGRVASSTLTLASTLEGEVEKGGKTVALVLKKDHRIGVAVGGEWPPSVKLPEPEAPVTPPAPSAPTPPPHADPGMTGMGD